MYQGASGSRQQHEPNVEEMTPAEREACQQDLERKAAMMAALASGRGPARLPPGINPLSFGLGALGLRGMHPDEQGLPPPGHQGSPTPDQGHP